MIQAFYKPNSEPITKHTPFRVLVVDHDEHNQWHVVLVEGTEWGAQSEPIDNIPVKDFDDGKPVFDRLYRYNLKSGWMPYSPQEAVN